MMTKAELQAADKAPNIDGKTFPGVDITSEKWKGWSCGVPSQEEAKREISCLLKSEIKSSKQEPNFHKTKLHSEVCYADHT